MTEVINFPEPVLISRVTKSKGPLTKIIRYDSEKKEVVKDGSECSMYSGSIKQIRIKSPVGFKNMLVSCKPNQAITHGIAEHKEASVVTKNKVGQGQRNGTPVIARTKDYIKYGHRPGVILLDHDKPREHSAGSKEALGTYSPDELLQLLAKVHPEIADAAYVSTPSTSSCIYDAEGNLLRGKGTGSHVYLFVENASDIPRYLDTFGKRLVLANLGRMEVSKAGSLLKRTVIDLVVGSPERLDFVAGAVCEDGLVQKLPEPTVKNGSMLDTTQLQDLTEGQEQQLEEVFRKLAEEVQPTQGKVIDEYVERESKKIAKIRNIDLEAAKEIIESRRNHVLQDEDILYFASEKEGVSVEFLLNFAEKYDGESLADPLEPGYEGGSRTKAKFYWNDGFPKIHSFAHGSSNYTFKQFNKGNGSNSNEKIEQTALEREVFNRYVFLASVNKVIDSSAQDTHEAMMVERAFILTLAGNFHKYGDAEGQLKTIPLSKHWLDSDTKKIASSLKYSPGRPMLFQGNDGRSYYNTYRLPYHSVPAIPDLESSKRLKPWHKIMATVFHIHASYLEDWFAFTIQKPSERSGIMPLCISDPGLGKSLIMAIISRAIGHQNFSNGKILDVTGLGRSGNQWGDWIYNKKISCIEEINPDGESGISYKVLDALKDIITNETLSLNLKGGRNGTFPIYANIIGFSNHSDCMKIPFGDRRVFVVDSTGQTKLSSEEYRELWEWLRDDQNIVALYQYLLRRKISDEFIPGQAKMTTAKRDMQADGRSLMQTAFDLVVEQFPSDLMTSGELQVAVAQAIHHIEGEEGLPPTSAPGFNADKQYNALLKSKTSLWGGGSRIRVQRLGRGKSNPTQIRVIRHKSDWADATSDEIKESMSIEIPLKWIIADDEIPF